MNHNIAQAMTEIAHRFPDRPGLVSKKNKGYRTWTFREINRTTDAFAWYLTARKIQSGDKVMLMVTPSLEFIALTFALFKLGAVVILIDPGMGYKNLGRCVAQVKPTVFIGIPKAHLFKTLFFRPFKSITTNVVVGPGLTLFGRGVNGDLLAKKADHPPKPFPLAETDQDDPAAILFTTGSTGPPKGVCYEHGIFQAQLGLIRNYYGITHNDIDQPAFPLFALFATALGACAVIPEMNPAQPAKVDPAKFIQSIIDRQVTYSFGSPAIWNVVSTYCLARKIRLTSLKKVLMAGAPVPGELIERVKEIIAEGGEIHTPYGATECLPITSMTGTEILEKTWALSRRGKGVCVGRPLPGITIRIMKISDQPLARWDDGLALGPGEIGEIVTKGPVVTRAYDNNDHENRLAKMTENQTIWHRLGDTGYLDQEGCLWFCGRRAHRVTTEEETLFTICCEAIFNEHPAISRSALVGIGRPGHQRPVLIVEPKGKIKDPAKLFAELKELAEKNKVSSRIESFLIHPAFPVDIRHNAKIFREKLAVWAKEQLTGGSR